MILLYENIFDINTTKYKFTYPVIVSILYFLGGFLGQFLTESSSYTATLWPPSGIMLAVFLISSRRTWGYYIPSALIANIAFDLLNGRYLFLSFLFSIGNLAETAVAALIITTIIKEKINLLSLNQLAMILLSALISSAISATIGFQAAVFFYGIKINWFLWWSGDVAGIMIFTPLVIRLVSYAGMIHNKNSLLKIFEFTSLIIVLILISILIFFRAPSHLPGLEFTVIIPLIWASLRFGLTVTTVCNALVTCLAIWGTANGYGPFTNEIETATSRVIAFQLFVGVAIFIVLVVSIIIQEKERSNKSLAESEERFRYISSTMSDIAYSCIKDLRGNSELNWLYGAVSDITGYSQKELLAMKCWGRIVVSEDFQIFKDHVLNIPPGRPEIANLRLKKKDGSIIWVRSFARCVRISEDSDYSKLYGGLVDITARKLAEEALHASTAKLETIVDVSPLAMVILDTKGNVALWNKAAEKMFGWNAGEVLGSPNPIIPNEKKEEHKKLLNSLMAGEPITELELERRRKDGSVIYTSLSSAPIYDSSENVSGMMAIIADITARKQAEKIIRENEERYRSVVLNTPLMNYVIDKNGNFTLSEGLGLKGLGLLPGQVVGTNAFELYKDYPSLLHYFKDALNGKNVRDEIQINNIIFDTSLTPVFSEGGEVEKIIGVSSDITERKKVEAELEKHKSHLEELVKQRTEELARINEELQSEIELKIRAEEQLEVALAKEKELNELKSRFISTASHEFRTPLTSILTSAQLIRKYANKWGPDKIDQHLVRIESSGNNLTKLMDDVISINKAESGKVKIDMARINIKHLCESIIEEILIQSNDNHHFRSSYNLESEFIISDEKQLGIILQNLLSNAFKYSPNGGEIDLIITSANNSINFVVRDQGLGIPENDIGKIFESFHRSENVEDIKGTGLGLSIVKNAVDMFGGKIDVKSTLGKGTIFDITIPINNDLKT